MNHRIREHVHVLRAESRDHVALRPILTLEYLATSADLALHHLVQRASREFVAAFDAIELLDDKDAMAQFLLADAGPKARALGVSLSRVEVREL